MIVCTEAQIRAHIQQNFQIVKAMETGFSRHSAGEVTMPSIMRIDFPEQHGEIDIKSAYVHGLNQFAVKMSTGFFKNQRLGLPSGNGMMLVFSAETGIPLAVLLDNGYLTHLRTAAAGAVAANFLANETVEAVGLIGTGAQSRYQLEALQLVRQFPKLYVHGRKVDNVRKFITDIRGIYSGEVIVCESAEELVRNSGLVITTTPAESPLIQAEWLHPGLHITAIGADAEHKNELDPAIFSKADRIVCDSKSQCSRLGELHHAYEANILDAQTPVEEIGAIVSEAKPDRREKDSITVCDLTGTGVQDTMIAAYAYELLSKSNAGTVY
ncbi:cyclodeaminase [Sediminibacillus halophilus]|uniref:Ornithine cyclodeaminase n=1 Tax=Sediminibacillus halophilus TaxID=482461 RepID=A0A1G9NNM1_9BACI|nr:cyclodeaminase [Sediminibacillus halophilus]SDL88186.1 ornithine cyclodeaminase [Sediminibacillus halophilus]